MSPRTAINLPSWAQASDKRRQHIARVTALLEDWAEALDVEKAERKAWCDAGRFHDALRDAPDSLLRKLARNTKIGEVNVLHGPAAAARLVAGGETRRSVIEAVRWHTLGWARWDRVGRALYMADFLEPGRSFASADRAYLAQQVPHDFNGTFRQVVRLRLEWTLRDGKAIHVQTAALWNSVR